ncbi:hypothetical protein BDV93DRAFT_219288 [Ceratobasidium sp. AG-I]|nr:hypothetical protein BDV93DRAFT_219288 [Ceratobasidium sp. AG-I]
MRDVQRVLIKCMISEPPLLSLETRLTSPTLLPLLLSPSSISIRHQTSPALFDYDGTNSGSVPLFRPGPDFVNTPNLDLETLQLQSGGMGFDSLDALLQMPHGSSTSLAIETQVLFSPQPSPLFSAGHSVSTQNSPTQRPSAGGQCSIFGPAGTKRVQPTGHWKNLQLEQLLFVAAPTQQRNYYGPSATARRSCQFREPCCEDHCEAEARRRSCAGAHRGGHPEPGRRREAEGEHCDCAEKPTAQVGAREAARGRVGGGEEGSRVVEGAGDRC